MSFLAREKYKRESEYFFFLMFFVFQTLQFNMSTKFLYEDGHGNVVDENGGPEPMD